MTLNEKYLDEVGELLGILEELGFRPVLVGGMALVTLGSRRVTKDFDFVIAQPKEAIEALVKVFYHQGLELAAKLNKNGDITATLDNAKVAALRLKIDAPHSAYFINPKTGLRIDLLFDFPISAEELFQSATKTKISSHVFYIASKSDLIRLKEIAKAKRANSADAQDLEFLKNLP